MIPRVPPDFFGTLPGWITALSTMGGFAWALMRFGLGWRKQSLDSDEQIRKLMAEELERVRKSYAVEVDRLTKKLDAKDEAFASIERHWREMLNESDRRHDECEASRHELRDELDDMHKELRLLRDKVLDAQAGRVLFLDATGDKRAAHAPSTVEAAKRRRDEGEGK